MDPIKNLAEATLASGIAADATTAPLVAGEGAELSTGAAFDVAIWNFTDYGDNHNAAKRAGKLELARVTRSTDTLTFVTRGLAPTSAIAHNTSGKVYKVRQVPTKELFDQLAPKSNAALTGLTTADTVKLNVTDLGTFASGNVTLSTTTAANRAALTGTAATVVLPATPIALVHALDFTTGASVVTVTLSQSLTRDDGDGVTAINTIQFLANCNCSLRVRAMNGVWKGVSAGGSVIQVLTSQLEAVSAGSLNSGNTAELARSVDVKAAIENTTIDDVLTSSAALGTDNAVVRADGVNRGTQSSSVTIDDDGVASTPGDYVVEGEEAGSIQLSDSDATSPETITITAPDDITTSFVQQLPAAAASGFLFGRKAASVVVESWDERTVTAGGTTGARTINKPYGSVNFAAAATSLVVTNDLVTTSSVILVTVATNDSTMKTATAVAGSGSFTIYANAAATGETRVNFVVF